MKSSIFSESKPAKPKRTSAVYLAGAKRAKAPPVALAPKKLWNLDALIHAYQESGELPPILLPTLPKREDDLSGEPMSLLLPTLPPMFSVLPPEKPLTLPPLPKRELPAPKALLPAPKALPATKLVALPVPKSVALPLPKLLLPAPKSLLPRPSKPSVKFINQMDALKPRFLVRITIDPAHYRLRLKNKLKLPVKLAGLGIRGATPVSAAASPSLAPPEKLTPLLEREFVDKRPKEVAYLAHAPSPSPNPGLPKRPELVATLELLSHDQREALRTLLSQKKTHWLGLARAARALCLEREQDDVRALMYGIDCVLLYVLAYDYDERNKLAHDVLPLERNWKLLESDIKLIIARINKANPPHQSLAEFFHIFAALLHQARAVVYTRVQDILRKVVLLYAKDDTLQARVIDLQAQALANSTYMAECMAASTPAFVNVLVPVRLPGTFHRKVLLLEKVKGESLLTNTQHNMRPDNKKYYLPIGPYSTLAEMAGLLYTAASEFIDIYNKNSGKRLDFTLKAGSLRE